MFVCLFVYLFIFFFFAIQFFHFSLVYCCGVFVCVCLYLFVSGGRALVPPTGVPDDSLVHTQHPVREPGHHRTAGRHLGEAWGEEGREGGRGGAEGRGICAACWGVYKAH